MDYNRAVLLVTKIPTPGLSSENVDHFRAEPYPIEMSVILETTFFS